ncbi:MAG: PRTRC system ThiF family protein [Chloroflexales bacterium]
MHTLTVERPVPFVLPPGQPIAICLVGCGGIGSHLAQSLARLSAHVREQSGPPLALTFIDGDTVERRNVGRQLFTAREVGKPKAQVLAERLNAAFGLGIVAVPAMATAGLLTELHPGYQTIGVLVGTVDTASGRRALHDALARSAWRIWLDVGNERDWGTVLLGTATEARQLRGALALGGICTALPAPTLHYPHLLDDAPIQPRADCANAAADGTQSLMVNQAMAAVAGQYLHQLVVARQITTCETALDLATLTMRSTAITAATIAAAAGLTVTDVTTLDDDAMKRTGGRT